MYDLTTCEGRNENSKVPVNICVKTTTETDVVQSENENVKKSVSASHFGVAMANSLRHPVINYHSNALQIQVTAVSQPITVG